MKNSVIATPRIMIAAPQGRSGKTLSTIVLCAALKERGLVVQPFKRGPDYIDPSWLTAACGRSCRNLDSVLMPESIVIQSFQSSCNQADLAVIEGAMGFYDGFDAEGSGSTARIARLLHCPVILVINASRMTRSVAAMVSGYQHFEPDTPVSGVILNYVSGSRHERKLVSAIENYCNIPVLGCIPRESSLQITERHLGLIPSVEAVEAEATIEHIRLCVAPHLDLDRILDIARSAQPFKTSIPPASRDKPVTVRIGVIRDRAFNFYYPENLEALVEAGGELIFINSFWDQQLPDIDALYIGGGFPEMFLPELTDNEGLRRDIARAVKNDLPVYAECAGLMYLCRTVCRQGKAYPMVGAIPADIDMSLKPRGHGYVKVEITEQNPFFPVGLTFYGHEFHHSGIISADNLSLAYRISGGHGITGNHDGIVYRNILASYTHLHARSVPQ